MPHGGWPVLPSKLDEIISTQEALVSNMTALDTVLSTTPAGGNLETADFEKVEARLKALLDDRKALDTLPERCLLEQEFASAGLNELVADLNARRVSVEQVRGEVQLAWWTTVFEDIVRSSAIISNQDGAALQAASDRFAQVDVEHVRSIGPMVSQESMHSRYRVAVHHRPRAAGGGDRPLRDGNQRKRQAADRHVASYRGGCCPISPCAAPVRIP